MPLHRPAREFAVSQPVDNSAAIRQAADLLAAAAESGQPCPPVRDLLADGSIDTAYAVQRMNTSRRLAGGHQLVGRKIGLTSKAVQQQLGVDQPDFGALLSDMAVPQGGTVPP